MLFKFRDEELATEVAWVVVYLSALSNVATNMLVKSDVLQLLIQRLATSNSLQLLIPVTCNMSLKAFISALVFPCSQKLRWFILLVQCSIYMTKILI